MITLRKAVDLLSTSPTLAITERVAALRSAGREVVHFGFGQSPFPVHPLMQEAVRSHAARGEYLPVAGLLALREAIGRASSAAFGVEAPAAHVVVGPGSKQMLFSALAVLEGPLLLPAPCWVSYAPQAQLLGKEIHFVRTPRAEGYKLSADRLSEAARGLGAGQKILLLNSPQNPSGAVYSAGECEALAEVCRRESLVVISDEIYALNFFAGDCAASFARACPERTVVTSGLSKAFSSGGYRVGYAAVADAAMRPALQAMQAVASETYSCVAAPMQYGALAAYERPEVAGYVAACTRIHAATAAYLHRRFAAMGVNCPPAEGGFYLFPDFERQRARLADIGVADASALAARLLEECAVASLPASCFGVPDQSLALRVATVDYDGAAAYRAASAVDALDDAWVEAHCPQLPKGCDAVAEWLAG